MNRILNGRTKALQPCACGCGKTAAWHRLTLFKGPDGKRYYILPGCREQFEEELESMEKLKAAVHGMSNWPFWRRLMYARLIFALQLQINVRRFGWKLSRAIARRSVAMLCLPKPVAKQLAKVWKWPARVQKEGGHD